MLLHLSIYMYYIYIYISVYYLPSGFYRLPAVNRFDGAPGMMIIHSSSTKGKEVEEDDSDDDDSAVDVDAALDEEVVLNSMYLENLFDADAEIDGITDERIKEAKINPLGIDVRATKNGSMEKKIFLDWTNHFKSQLPSDQGKGAFRGKEKEPVFCLLDGHNSRWELSALLNMMANNIFTFYLASHTSIWSQPNDAGSNKKMHGEIEKSTDRVNKGVDSASVAYLNGIIFTAIRGFIDSEHKMLEATGSNNATDGWYGVGLHPAQPKESQTWSSAMSMSTDISGERTMSYEPAVREDAALDNITDEEREKLLANYGVDSMFNHPFAAAVSFGRSILRKWREEGDLTVAPAEMEGLSEEEAIALKLICFKNPADGIKTSASPTKGKLYESYVSVIYAANTCMYYLLRQFCSILDMYYEHVHLHVHLHVPVFQMLTLLLHILSTMQLFHLQKSGVCRLPVTFLPVSSLISQSKSHIILPVPVKTKTKLLTPPPALQSAPGTGTLPTTRNGSFITPRVPWK